MLSSQTGRAPEESGLIDIADVFVRMLTTKDDDPCPCMSGQPFGGCHKLKLQKDKENPKKLLAELIRIKRNKECLYGKGYDCKGAIVKAHSVSKKYLRQIAKPNNHVYSFIKTSKNMQMVSELFYNGILPDPEKIGINDVTTFSGLCQKHDNDLFQCFEKNAFECSDEQVKALHLRPILKEIFVKTEVLMTTHKAQEAIGKVFDGDIAEQKNAFSLIMALGSELSIRDLYVELGLSKDLIKGSSKEKLSYVCFEIDSDCPSLCSSTVNPCYDLKGNQIQNYNDEDVFTRSFSLNVIAEQKKYYVLLSWFTCEIIDDFIRCFFSRSDSDILQFLTQFPFAYSENLAINIKWFDSLRPIKRERLKKIFFSEIINLDSAKEMYKELSKSVFTEGKLIGILSNSEAVPTSQF